jgi:hypothetical protein
VFICHDEEGGRRLRIWGVLDKLRGHLIHKLFD